MGSSKSGRARYAAATLSNLVGVPVKAALALVALMGSLVALPTLARPDATAADVAVRAFMATEGIPAAHVTIIRGDELILQRVFRPALSSRLADGTHVPYGFGLSTREFLGHSMVWHGGNVDSHSTMIAYLPEEDTGLVILTSKGFVWLTELMPALLGDAPPARASASGPPPFGRFEDGLFRYATTTAGERLRVEIDLIGPLDFIPAGPREYVAEKYPATFRIRLPADGSRDRFELDWGEVRSYARRMED